MNAWKVPAAEWFRKLRAVMVDAPSDFPERLPTIQNATWAITLLEGMVESPPDAQPREPTPSPAAGHCTICGGAFEGEVPSMMRGMAHILCAEPQLASPAARPEGGAMIKIHPSPTADTRTCDFTKVTKDTLYKSSIQHIGDIEKGLDFFSEALTEAALRHDHDKLSGIDAFHADFVTGFKQTGWWDNHRKVNRHHLTMADGIPADVNLIDVLDFIVDCVMAGMARSGSVFPLALPPELLERAFQNTVELLKANVEVVSPPPHDGEGA